MIRGEHQLDGSGYNVVTYLHFLTMCTYMHIGQIRGHYNVHCTSTLSFLYWVLQCVIWSMFLYHSLQVGFLQFLYTQYRHLTYTGLKNEAFLHITGDIYKERVNISWGRGCALSFYVAELQYWCMGTFRATKGAQKGRKRQMK